MKLYHGVALSKSSYEWNPFDAADYDYLKGLGLNSVQFELWWTQDVDGFEMNELQPGVYNMKNINTGPGGGLDGAVALAQSKGFDVVLASRVAAHIAGEGGFGWADTTALGAKYVNLNTQDASGSYGRTRYCNWIKWLAGRYKSCIMNPWHFPYHAETFVGSDESVLYNQTLPALINAVRSAGNFQTICLTLMAQGVTYGTGFKNESGQFVNPLFTAALPSLAADGNIMFMGNNHDAYINNPPFSYMDMIDNPYNAWNYDTAALNAQLQPAVDFNKSYPYGCAEFAALVAHTNPIDPSRLEWLRLNFEKFKANNMSWWFWRDERVNDITSYDVSALRNPDGTLNQMGVMVKSYASGTAPPTPTAKVDFAFNKAYQTGTPVNLALT